MRIHPDDLLVLKEVLWPHVRFFGRQVDVIKAVLTHREAYIPAANKVGKDFIGGFLALGCFVICQARGATCRIVTTSVAGHHLNVMWGEIGRFIETARRPLVASKGGPLVVNHLEIRRAAEMGSHNPLNYLIGLVSAKGEGLAGHHADFTLLIGDESSSLDDQTREMGQGWARHMLFLGNPNDCRNFWRKACDELKQVPGGDDGSRVRLQVRAEHSPNVARRQTVWPGLLSWEEYQDRRANWEPWRQCVGLDAEFWEGGDVLMFPPDLLSRSALAAGQSRRSGREEKAIGCDPGEGQANTAWSVVDCHGLVELVSERTPDTAVIPDKTITLMKRWNVPDGRVCFDRGGGGFQHAAEMRRRGYRGVRSVAFGEAVTDDDRRHRVVDRDERRERREERTAYLNRRAQLYGGLREAVLKGFGIPARYTELRRQLGLMPLMHDSEGKMRLPPKSRKGKGGERSLQEILGCSPDEADSLVVALFSMNHRERRAVAGAAW